MVRQCCICKQSTKKKKKLRLFNIPTTKANSINLLQKFLVRKRFDGWLIAIGKNYDIASAKKQSVCSSHFISEAPSPVLDVTNVDWIPSLNLKSRNDVEVADFHAAVTKEYHELMKRGHFTFRVELPGKKGVIEQIEFSPTVNNHCDHIFVQEDANCTMFESRSVQTDETLPRLNEDETYLKLELNDKGVLKRSFGCQTVSFEEVVTLKNEVAVLKKTLENLKSKHDEALKDIAQKDKKLEQLRSLVNNSKLCL